MHNAKIITWGRPNEIIENGGLYLSEGLISDLGASSDLLEGYPDEERIDAAGQYVMPGNICAHTHFYGVFARGMAIPGKAPKDFPDILRKLWWPLDQALTMEDVQYSTLVCLVDTIKHGTTTLIDHHASPNAIHGSLDVIAEAVEESGLRAALCYEVTDRGGEEKSDAGISQNLRFLNRLQSDSIADGRLAGELFTQAPIGVIEKGACADLIFVDYHPATPMKPGNLPWHMIFGFHESMITATIVAGRLLMQDRVLTTLDEERISARSRELAEDVWQRYQSYVPTD